VTIIVTVDDAGYDAVRVDVLPEVGPVGPKSQAPQADEVVHVSALAFNQPNSAASGLPVYSAELPSASASRSIRRKLAVAAVGLAVLAGLLWLSQPDRRSSAATPSVPTPVAEPDGASPSTKARGPETSTPSSVYPDCSDAVLPCEQPWPLSSLTLLGPAVLDPLTPDAGEGVSP
jgi:hypothetical protein